VLFAAITNQNMMIVNILTPDDLQTFKEGLLEELARLLDQRKNTPDPTLLRSHEVRRLLKISTNSLRKLRLKGTLPFIRIGTVLFYDAEDIRRVLEENRGRSSERGGLLPGEETITTKRRKS
jgi:hypothetical protein